MRLNGHQSQSGNYFRKFAEHHRDFFHPCEMPNSLNVEILFGNLPSIISMYLFLDGKKLPRNGVSSTFSTAHHNL